jgi:uncharacterized protein YndB with AHSA1/START domain
MSLEPLIEVESSLHSDHDRGVVRMRARYEADVDDLWSALTEPARLARWYGKVEGNLRSGGEYTAFIPMSGWDGHGRIEECDPPRRLRVTTWEEVGNEQVVTAELAADGQGSLLEIEVRGTPLDVVWAYGAGWQMHAEHLGVHLAGHECGASATRWEELEPSYRAKAVVPIES